MVNINSSTTKAKAKSFQPHVADHARRYGSNNPSGLKILLVIIIGICAKLYHNFTIGHSPLTIICSKSRNIYTVDDVHPRVVCISVQSSRILAIGNYADIIPAHNYLEEGYISGIYARMSRSLGLSPTVRVIQLSPEYIMVPGLADAHAHILENGYMMRLPLAGTTSAEDVVGRVKAYILAHPELMNDTTTWIEGMGWDHTKWADSQFPTAEDLDKEPFLRNRRISLSRVDGHARWVSRAVLDMMDIPEKVDGGVIVRDSSGRPTGIFVDNAMDLIPVPPWDEATMSEFFNLTIKEAISYGLTSIHDADTSPERIKFFRGLADKGLLPIRLYLMGYIESSSYWGDRIPKLSNYGKHGRLNLRSVKFFADGALGSWSAALSDPYADNTQTNGLLRYDTQVLKDLVARFFEDGWQTNIHCIGDRANHIALDIFEAILRNHSQDSANASTWRPRIEHAIMFNSSNLGRLHDLGVIASVQPTQATTDMWYAEDRLGSERLKNSYTYQSLLRASAKGVLPLGSDFPVEGVNPLLGFYAAVSRTSVEGTSPHGPGGWFPEQRLTRDQALKGMTYDAAYASFTESELGSLSAGKKADFVIFDKDIMTVPLGEILEAKVVATVVDGEVIYGKL